MQCNPAVRKTAAYQRRIDGLGLPAWQADVQAKLYWVLLYQDVSERPQVIQMKAAADAILAKYERMEIVSLLELAVWKSICIVSPQQPRATTTNSHSSKSDCNVVQKFDYHTWQEWSRQGWKSVKASLRKSNEIGIIITLVLPDFHSSLQNQEMIVPLIWQRRKRKELSTLISVFPKVKHFDVIVSFKLFAVTEWQRGSYSLPRTIYR
jgi:hypothetical protein